MPSRRRPVTSPIIKKPGAPGGFVPIPYPNALREAGRGLAGVAERHGEAAIAVVGDAASSASIALETGDALGGLVSLLVQSGWVLDVADGEAVAVRTFTWRAERIESGFRSIRDARELVRAIQGGEVKALISVCFEPPPRVALARALDSLEFHLAIDRVLGRVAARADIVLPADAAIMADGREAERAAEAGPSD